MLEKLGWSGHWLFQQQRQRQIGGGEGGGSGNDSGGNSGGTHRLHCGGGFRSKQKQHRRETLSRQSIYSSSGVCGRCCHGCDGGATSALQPLHLEWVRGRQRQQSSSLRSRQQLSVHRSLVQLQVGRSSSSVRMGRRSTASRCSSRLGHCSAIQQMLPGCGSSCNVCRRVWK